MLNSLRHAEGTRLLCHFGTPHPLIHTENSPKSNYSRTSGTLIRNSYHSRTYAKTGGVPPCPEPRGASSNMTNRSISELSPCILTAPSNKIVGPPTFSAAPPSFLFLLFLCALCVPISVLPSLSLSLWLWTVNCPLSTVSCELPFSALPFHIRLFFAKTLRQSLLESTLPKLRENKRLYPPLESTLSKNRGKGYLPQNAFSCISFVSPVCYLYVKRYQ